MSRYTLTIGRRLLRPFGGNGETPEAGLSIIDEVAPEESVDCWPLAINSSTQSGARPYAGSHFF